MKRVLRSSTMHKREKGLLDLNKEPCENKGFLSDSDSSADYFSAEGNEVGIGSVSHPSECERDADSSVGTSCPTDYVAHDLGNGWKGEKGENVVGPVNGDTVHAKDCEDRCQLINSPLAKGGICESQPLGYPRETAGAANDAMASGSGAFTNRGALGQRRRGRKRKMAESPRIEGATEKDSTEELVHLPLAQNGVEEKSNGSAESLKLVKNEDASQSKVDEINEDAHMGRDLRVNEIDDAAGNSNKDKVFGHKRRGRKRKIVESVGDNKDNWFLNKKPDKVALGGKPQVVGRLLRSRTKATNDGEKQLSGKEDVDFVSLQVRQEVDASEKKNAKMKLDGRTRANQKGGKVLKGRRGRPPKSLGINGNSKVIVKKKAKLGSQKNIKLPKAGDTIEDYTNSGSSELLDYQGGNIKKHKNECEQPSEKGLKLVNDSFQNGLASEQPDSENNTIWQAKNKSKDKKDGDLGRREEQQLVRDEIISLIKKVGWTIEYRPRMGREYNDAVYVDWEGKTYWSVTLAYRSLKDQVENGTADARVISLFTPISEDKLSTLLRIRKEKKEAYQKKKKVGSKTGKVRKLKLKKSALECPGFAKSNGNLKSRPSLGDVSTRRKTKRSICEQGGSMTASCRGRPRSNRGTEIRKPCALMARGPANGLDPDDDGFELYEGKRNLLSWMIDLGTVALGAKVKYMNQRRTNVMLEGKIGREGLCCGCCNRILTVLDFESHAGSRLGQPFNHVYLESGSSLLQCLKDSWRKQEEIDDIGFHLVDVNNGDPNDDTCNICGDGGDLICCDGCPSTFHQSCLQIQKFPSGDWYCLYCSCKFCGIIAGKANQREELHDTEDSALLSCHFCEEKFHESCIQENDAPQVNSKGLPFCGRGCQKLSESLEMLLGAKHELEEGYSWTIIRRQDINKDNAHCSDSSKTECNSKLAIAFSILDECFLPISDQRSKTSMIQSVVYSCGSNFKRLNYSGFCTFILERGDELVSAAAIRIHGNQLAEMPFIGTRSKYRRQGMCRRLLSAIETVLLSLEVEKLVIPAVSELNETWTKVFGFVPLEESKRQEMKYMSMIVFPGIDMLQKPLFKPQFTEGELTTATGTELSQLPIENVRGSSDPGPDSDAPEVKLQRCDDESVAAVGSGPEGPDNSLKDVIDITNGLDSSTLFPKATDLTDTKSSKCNFNLNQLSASGVESNSLMKSNKRTLESNNMEKMFSVPKNGKEASRYQHETDVQCLKPLCGFPVTPVLKSDDCLSHMGGVIGEDSAAINSISSNMISVKKNSICEDSAAINSISSNMISVKKNSIAEDTVAINSIASNMMTDQKVLAVHALLSSQQEKDNVDFISNAPHDDTPFQTDALKVHKLGLVNHETETNSIKGVFIRDDSHLSSKGVEDFSSMGYSGQSLCNLSTHSDVTCLSTPGKTCSVPEVDPSR